MVQFYSEDDLGHMSGNSDMVQSYSEDDLGHMSGNIELIWSNPIWRTIWAMGQVIQNLYGPILFREHFGPWVR